jgi:hypothetical protein
MKHINKWKIFENSEQSVKPAGKYQGFCLTAVWNYDRDESASIMIAGSYLTVHDFMYTVWEQLVGDWDEDEEDEFFQTDISDLMAEVSNYTETNSEWQFWAGLEPKSQKEDWDSCSLLNPGVTMSIINSMFSNASSVMVPNSGNDTDEVSDSYIAKSIANKPELITRYMDSPIFPRVKKLLGWNDQQIDLIVNYYHNLRGMI